MATVTIDKTVFRNDSGAKPVVTGSGVGGSGFLKIHDWLYLPFSSPQIISPPNYTRESVPVVLNDNIHPAFTTDSGISAGASASVNKSAASGYTGAYYNTALSAVRGSIQAKIMSNTLSGGISLQPGAGAIVHNYGVATVAHSIFLDQYNVGLIRELGAKVETNASFKYAVGDSVMIEYEGIAPYGFVRYYLIKADGTMKLIRSTRSKLTSAPKGEIMLYHNGASFQNVYLNSNNQASTSFENVGVSGNWQKWGNQRINTPNFDVLEMADKRTETTAPNPKKILKGLQLTPYIKSLAEFHAFMSFYNYHSGEDQAFIFKDYARKELDGTPHEFWAKFSGPLSETPINGCLFNGSVTITEEYRNDYVAVVPV